MNEALPSLTALKVFASCARNCSFTRAADELGITPGAVTQHIRSLEQWAGTPLFRRTGRSVLLTDRAEAALPFLTDGFGQISEGVDMLRVADEQAHVVTVVSPPSFASKWLLGRLDAFRGEHPTFDVWVSVDAHGSNQRPSDIYIRYGIDPGDGFSEALVHDEVVPVASPDFVRQHGVEHDPARLATAPLLHYQSDKIDASFPDWPGWFKAHGVGNAVESTRGARFDHPGMLIDQAVSGRGAALAKRILATHDLREGRLLQLFGDATPVRSAYWLGRPRGRTLRPPVEAFIDWIRRDVLTVST